MMEEIILNFVQNNAGITIFILLIVVPVYYKMGVFDMFLNRDKKQNSLRQELGFIRDNHLHELKEGISENKKSLNEACKKLDRMTVLLENMKEFGIKIRKE